MTQKTFEVAGTSTINGVTKVRFANDYVGRFKILAKNGHENIELIELGSKLSKAEICQVLLNHPKFPLLTHQLQVQVFLSPATLGVLLKYALSSSLNLSEPEMLYAGSILQFVPVYQSVHSYAQSAAYSHAHDT